jgi:hypothetical protein
MLLISTFVGYLAVTGLARAAPLVRRANETMLPSHNDTISADFIIIGGK